MKNLTQQLGSWTKVKNLKVGQKIAVPTKEALGGRGDRQLNVGQGRERDEQGRQRDVKWDEIISIKPVGRDQVYDIEVDGTRNFVGNGIFAHNTYIQGLAVNRDVAVNTGDIDISGSYLTSGADYAEYFYSEETDLAPGEAVCLDVTNNNAVKRCQTAGETNIIGIISSHPSVIGNASHTEERNQVVVGLLGQIPAKVSTENGDIRPGDSLTSASKAGYLMKANAGDATVGVALEGFTGADEGGLIQVLISRRNKSLTVEQVEQEVTERISQMEIKDEVDLIISQAQKTLDSQIASFSLSIDENAKGILGLQGSQAQAEEALTSFKLDFQTMAGSQEVLSQEVSILSQKMADLEVANQNLESELEQSKTDLEKTISASSDATLIEVGSLVNNLQDLVNSLSGLEDVSDKIKLMSDSVLSVMSSNQALSARLDEIEAGSKQWSELISITPEKVILTTPEMAAREEDSQAVKKRVLVLDARSGLEINSQNFKLDVSGNLTLAGDLLLGGNLQAALISPDGSEIRLAPKGENPKVTVEGDLEIKGKVLTSSRAKFNDQGEAESQEDKTTGTAKIIAGQTKVDIVNNQITDDSLIYITPTARTNGQILFVSAKRSFNASDDAKDDSQRQGFTVAIESSIVADIEFNWWIVE